MLRKVKQEYQKLCIINNVDDSHGIEHVCAVHQHVINAILYSNIKFDPSTIMALQLAALLHDADDHKYFSTTDYDNARMIMKEANVDEKTNVKAIKMIDLVSCSKNGNTIPEECIESPELLWPRWADRLEAIGAHGVVRCWEYNTSKGLPLASEFTPKPISHEEALSYASKERFEVYVENKNSASMIDHYYDKLIYIAKPESNETQNMYFDYQFENQLTPFLDVCVLYTKEGMQGVSKHISKLKDSL